MIGTKVTCTKVMWKLKTSKNLLVNCFDKLRLRGCIICPVSHNSGKVKMNTNILASGLILIIFAKLFIQQTFTEYLLGAKQYSIYSPLCIALEMSQ